MPELSQEQVPNELWPPDLLRARYEIYDIRLIERNRSSWLFGDFLLCHRWEEQKQVKIRWLFQKRDSPFLEPYWLSDDNPDWKAWTLWTDRRAIHFMSFW